MVDLARGSLFEKFKIIFPRRQPVIPALSKLGYVPNRTFFLRFAGWCGFRWLVAWKAGIRGLAGPSRFPEYP